MQKIISLFKRDYEGTRQVYNEVVPGAEWVLEGEGVATLKWDGTSCMIRDGRLYRRYDVKKGRTPPPDFEPAQDPDPVTGHWPGWVPVGNGPDDRWHRESLLCGFYPPNAWPDNTYELVGPKIQGNPHNLDYHQLHTHGKDVIEDAPRSFDGIRDWLASRPHVEGIVWHHPDGRMVKIKRKDFGLPWPPKK